MTCKSEHKAVTLRHVARRAGVSESTASRVLNRSEVVVPISERTRSAVLEAARELGYAPSIAARALRLGASRCIGVLGTSPEFFRLGHGSAPAHAEFLGAILSGLLDATVRHGYNITLLTGLEKRDASEMDLLATFGMADGLLVLNRDLSADAVCTSALDLYARPKVHILDYRDADTFVRAPDDVQGGALAMQTLLERGHQRVALVMTPHFFDIFSRRKAGALQALEHATKGADALVVVNDVAKLTPSMLRKLRVTAAICVNLPCAEQFAAVCAAAKIKIPGDIEVITFASIGPGPEASRPEQPEFAAVVAPLSKIVSSGVDLLVDLLAGKHRIKQRKLFPYIYRAGKSCAAQTKSVER